MRNKCNYIGQIAEEVVQLDYVPKDHFSKIVCLSLMKIVSQKSRFFLGVLESKTNYYNMDDWEDFVETK